MILGIICFLFSILGVYGFYNDLYFLTYIAFVLCFLENLLGRFNGSSKTIMPFFIACIIGIIFTRDFWLGISIGSCFETIITFVGGIILLLFIKNKKNRRL